MADYIDRDAVISEIERREALMVGDKRISVDAMKSFIKNRPAVDVAPVRHGRWKCNKPCPVCGEDRFDGLDADIWSDWEPPYCPNCGAKMDGGFEND